jgi:hypothetical protein
MRRYLHKRDYLRYLVQQTKIEFEKLRPVVSRTDEESRAACALTHISAWTSA